MGRPKRIVEAVDDEPEHIIGEPLGLLKALDGTGGNLHAIHARLGEIANIIGDAIDEAQGDIKISLQALASLL